jgi:hypothetical protein
MTSYAVVIPTLARDTLADCLAALAAATGPRPEQIVLVDDRPAVLRLVLTTTGSPVRRSKAASMRATSGSRRSSTVWMRAVPSTWTTAGMRSRQAAATSWTKSM